MSWCTREEPVKKKKVQAVLEKKKVSSGQETNILYPKSKNQIQESKKYSQDDKKKLKQKLKKAKVEEIITEGQIKAVGSSQGGHEKVVLKKLQKCGYDLQELDKKYKGTKDKWIDPDFSYQELKVHGEVVKWKRPQQFLKEPDLFPEEISPNDVFQGHLEDCYFLSAMSALAEKDYRIRSLFSVKEYNPNGYYIVKLYFNGIYQEVIVDDLFPVDSHNNLVFVRAAKDKYIWTLILEKCWAKLLKGYPRMNLGYNSEGFQTLTGAPTTTYILRQHRTPDDPKCYRIFQKLLQSQQRQYCSLTSVYNYQGEVAQKMYDDGLPTGHVYSLLGAFIVKLKDNRTVRLIQIRNPWGTLDSKLPWHDDDPQWNLVSEEEKKRINFQLNKSNQDGVFYMDWDTFALKFNYFCSICEVSDNANYLYLELQVEDRVPIYLEVQSDGSPEDLAIHFVQQMQQHFREDHQIDYPCINVIVSKQGVNSHNQKTYEFMHAFTYYRKAVDNYFTLPRKQFPKGKYLLRLYVYDPVPKKQKAKTPLVVGLYSPAVVGLQVDKTVDDMEFIQKNCIFQAKKNGKKKKMEDDSSSWVVRQIFPDTNLGFLVFHHGNKSKHQHYQLHFKNTQDKNLYYLLEHLHQSEFVVESERGYEQVVVFAYIVENMIAMDKNLFPNYKPEYVLPRPQILPK